MFNRLLSEGILAFLRLFIDVEWESLKLTFWSGARLCGGLHALERCGSRCRVAHRPRLPLLALQAASWATGVRWRVLRARRAHCGRLVPPLPP